MSNETEYHCVFLCVLFHVWHISSINRKNKPFIVSKKHTRVLQIQNVPNIFQCNNHIVIMWIVYDFLLLKMKLKYSIGNHMKISTKYTNMFIIIELNNWEGRKRIFLLGNRTFTKFELNLHTQIKYYYFERKMWIYWELDT